VNKTGPKILLIKNKGLRLHLAENWTIN